MDGGNAYRHDSEITHSCGRLLHKKCTHHPSTNNTDQTQHQRRADARQHRTEGRGEGQACADSGGHGLTRHCEDRKASEESVGCRAVRRVWHVIQKQIAHPCGGVRVAGLTLGCNVPAFFEEGAEGQPTLPANTLAQYRKLHSTVSDMA
eukprot:1416730-Rhodomonas_salina.2